jgi:ATP-binding cassette, subfamily F, member 3
VLLDVKGLSFGYTPEHLLFKDVSFTLEKGQCLAIIGKNGSGKSTLLNTIAGELTPLGGEVAFHPSTEFGHFGQTNISRLDPGHTIMEEIYEANPKLSAAVVRGICGGMMFSGDRAEKKVSLLSGGEKSRVMLGQILARPANLLFLDEPTHHLDIDSIEALMVAIEHFKGSCIIVTHSEEMLRRVADRLIIFSKNGAEYFDGGYDDFLEKIGWGEEDQVERVKTAPKNNYKANKKALNALTRERSKATAPLRKSVEKLEKAIMESESRIKTLHAELIAASNSGDNSKVMELSQSVGKEEKAVEADFEQLAEAQEALDELMASYEKRFAELEG